MLTKRLDQLRAMAMAHNLLTGRSTAAQQVGRIYSTKKMQNQQQQPQKQQQQQQPQQQQKQQQQQPQQQKSSKQMPQQKSSKQMKEQQQQQQQQQESSQKQELSPEQTPSHDDESKGGAAMSEVDWLTQELATIKVEHKQLLDKYKRALADGENLRRRLNRQIDEAKLFGIQGFCKDLIEVADVLGHATRSVPKDKLSTNAELKSLYEGLNLTRASLQQVFKRHGVEILDPINQKFDPNLHEALFQTVDKSVDADTVVQVNKLGYKLHKRCIRPALVGVSKR
ncbi:PREDICTED: grpE protein homolog, mitochondrial-like [Drosophila arizonae]|uniref:GrpE protein homolog n=1 Tax=Drosophila arizonae TaxID=7263 RepID=A0ABM1PZ16_DROAR|nr:PREDICTED: grpE protein homolog, mitochondrial-like [Drosophila arizonae]